MANNREMKSAAMPAPLPMPPIPETEMAPTVEAGPDDLAPLDAEALQIPPAPLPVPDTSKASPPPPVTRGIEVMAMRPGFYRQNRYSVGDKFMVRGTADLGSWMRCTDPTLEKQHLRAIQDKKRLLKAGSK